MLVRAQGLAPRRLRIGIAALSAVLIAAACLAALSAPAARAATAVDVFPTPGSQYVPVHAQIAFRGIAPGAIGTVTVTGSVSGAHAGTWASDSDGQGASFLPAQAFAPGETVTVATGLNIAGAPGGTFQFKVATPAGPLPPWHWPRARRARGDVQRFVSRPDLSPVSISVTRLAHGTDSGFIFVAPEFGPLQDGPMILDAHGKLVWFKPLSGDDVATDFRVQAYQGQPVLTWWQGYVSAGVGTGVGEIYNDYYKQIAVVHAADGLNADMHEFLLTPHNTALITAVDPVWVNARSVHGPRRQLVFDSIVQEIDIQTGLKLFAWHSLDHVPLADSFAPLPASHKGGSPYDYFHVNSIDLDHDGNLLISSRNTWAAYKVDHGTGQIIWRLGGKHSSFKLRPGAYWAFQHDVRVRASNDRYITLFDNSASPTIHSQSRAVKLVLNLTKMIAALAQSEVHSPSLLVPNQGNYQQIAGYHSFVGWGAKPYFSEYDSRGRLLFDAHFGDSNSNYRAYKLSWSGWVDPTVSPPAVAAIRHGSHTTVYASWNGATHVHQWRVLAGSSPTSLTPVRTVTRSDFETSTSISTASYVAVQALDWSGNLMATSKTIAVH